MNIHNLVAREEALHFKPVLLACGGGGGGPSAAEMAAQEQAARDRARAEADKVRAEQDLERQKQAQKALADQVAMANADAARRQKNRTLLAGVAADEGQIDPLTGLPKPKKSSTLIGG